MKIKLVKFDSNEYHKLVILRKEILRKPLGLQFSKEELANEKDQYHFVVLDNNKIIAGLILVQSDKNSIKMRQVCVAQNKQGQGIGNKLVKHIEIWSKEKGYKLIYCHARQNALEFYSKLDYVKEGNSFKEVGLEHYKLLKTF